MIRNIFVSVLLALALLGCNMQAYNRTEAPSLFAALDEKPNGHSGAFGAGLGFRITGTKASDTLLCRTFEIVDKNKKTMHEYCKIKGGEWR
jgi:hypothetical protein